MYLLDNRQDPSSVRLVPLGEADWPDWVKEEIASFFERAGVEDPLRRKLVEPDLAGLRREMAGGGVDWDHVVAYYKYEALSVLLFNDETARAKAEAMYAEFLSGHRDRVRRTAAVKDPKDDS